MRYTSQNLLPASTVSLGLEYFKPDYSLTDSIYVESFQLIPNITGRIHKQSKEENGIYRPVEEGPTG